MNQIRVIVCDWTGEWTGVLELEMVERLVAALSSDPESIVELSNAYQQFEPSHDPKMSPYLGLASGAVATPAESGLIMIDLAARKVIWDGPHELSEERFQPEGMVPVFLEKHKSEVLVNYRLHKDWEFEPKATDWKVDLLDRRRVFAKPPLDARAILYGEELWKHIARQVRAWIPQVADLESYEDLEEAMDEIHEAWLLSPRLDLEGLSPRRWIIKGMEHVTTNLDDRCRYWSLTELPPPSIPTDSIAYRLGGFGRHEAIIYHDYVRHLQWTCWKWNAIEEGDARDLEQDVAALKRESERWLHEPIAEFFGRTPQGIIDRERRRLPEMVDPEEAVLDCDCPLCVMLSELPGVSFWHLDDSHIPADSPFSMDDDSLWEEFDEDETFAFQTEPTLKYCPYDEDGTFEVRCDEDGEFHECEEVVLPEVRSNAILNCSSLVKLFGVGCKLTVLISTLKARQASYDPTLAPEVIQSPEAVQAWVDLLMRQWGNLREVVHGENGPSEAMFEPVIEGLRETLEEIAISDSSLNTECQDVHQALDQLELMQVIS